MRKLPLDKMKHRCRIRARFISDSKNAPDPKPISSSDIEYGTKCKDCDELLATPAQAIAYLYAQLTEGN